MLTAISLLATSAIGMLGWFFAWRTRGEEIQKDKQLADAAAGESAAKALAIEAGARATAAEASLSAARATIESTQRQLDAERKSKQDLLDALSRSGIPVGGVVVDASLDGLYKDSGSPGAGSGGGSDPHGVSGQPAGTAGAPRKS